MASDDIQKILGNVDLELGEEKEGMDPERGVRKD